MKFKYSHFNCVQEEKGFIFITMLLILVVVSILAMGLVSITMSNFKQTGLEHDFQGVYHIAEAGISQTIYSIGKKVDELSEETLTHEEFFQQLDSYIDENIDSNIFSDFEKNFGQQPLAGISIGDIDIVENEKELDFSRRVQSYTISSKGKIGKSNRTVNTRIEIAHGIEIDEEIERSPVFDYAIYGGGNSIVKLPSQSKIDGSIYGHDLDFKASGTRIDGSVVSEKAVKLSDNMQVNGNIYAMDGRVEILSSDTKVTGDIHAKDNVILKSGTTLYGNIYTKGQVHLESSASKLTGDINSVGNVKFGSGAETQNIYTMGNVEFSTNNIIKGNINAMGNVGNKDTGGNVEVGGDIISGANVVTRAWQNYKFKGNVYAKGNVENGSNNEILGNVIASGSVNDKGKIGGSITENMEPTEVMPPSLPEPPNLDFYKPVEMPELNKELLKYDPSRDKEKFIDNILRLSPANYGIVEFSTDGNQILILESGGSYFLNSITGGNQNKTLRFDFSNGGNINIYVKNNLKWNGKVELSIDGKEWIALKNLPIEDQKKFAERIYWETHGSFEIHEGGDKQFLGTLLSKDSIQLTNKSYMVGAFSAYKDVYTAGDGITLIYASKNAGPGNNQGTGDPDGEENRGQNIISSNARLKISMPVRERGKLN